MTTLTVKTEPETADTTRDNQTTGTVNNAEMSDAESSCVKTEPEVLTYWSCMQEAANMNMSAASKHIKKTESVDQIRASST